MPKIITQTKNHLAILVAALSIITTLTISTAIVSADVIDCVNTNEVCTVNNSNDVEARNYCTQRSLDLIDSAYNPQNTATDKEGMRMAIYHSCYVGYNNGLNKTSPQDTVSVCEGSTLTEAKDRTQTDFPQICKDAYEKSSGTSLAGVSNNTNNNGGSSSTSGACPDSSNQRFLTMPAWYRGVLNDKCEPTPAAVNNDLGKFTWTIAFNIVEIMMHIVGYISGAFVIVGGYRFMTSAGSPETAAAGRKTILNALIGLVVSIMSIGIVNLIVSRL